MGKDKDSKGRGPNRPERGCTTTDVLSDPLQVEGTIRDDEELGLKCGHNLVYTSLHSLLAD